MDLRNHDKKGIIVLSQQLAAAQNHYQQCIINDKTNDKAGRIYATITDGSYQSSSPRRKSGSRATTHRPLSAAGGSRALTAAVTFDVPATTVRWFGFWSSGVFVGYAANGGAQLLYVVDTVSNNIRSPAHGLANGQKIVFFNGTVPAPLTEGQVYFVVGATTDTLQVSATLAGAAITLTGQPSNSSLATMVEDVYAAQGSHTLSADSYGLIF